MNPRRVLFESWCGLGVALLLTARPVWAQSRVEYRYEQYQEDNDRVQVQTQGFWFQTELPPHVVMRGQFVHDALSGATPNGGPPPPGSDAVPLAKFKDERNAGFLESAIRYGRSTTTPQLAYSEESDYRSLGVSLTEAVDFNSKNTTLIFGLSRNFDSLNGTFQRRFVYKGETVWLLGINQLLSPLSVLTVNLTLNYQDGFLSDPYKGVNFAFRYPNPVFDPTPEGVNLGENRPRHRFTPTGFINLTQYVPRLKGSADINYRVHHNDWGIWSHTLGLEWHQNLGPRVVLSPLFRYYRQSAANFYGVRFTGDPLLPQGAQYALQSDGFTLLFNGDEGFPGDGATGSVPGHPAYFSSDYRLSELETFTFGVGIRVKLWDQVSFLASYKRYEMRGLDGVTPTGQYPSAHAGTVGLVFEF